MKPAVRALWVIAAGLCVLCGAWAGVESAESSPAQPIDMSFASTVQAVAMNGSFATSVGMSSVSGSRSSAADGPLNTSGDWPAAVASGHRPAQPVQTRARASATPTVYLTFDDGPSERYTPQILDVLRRKRVRATFFVVGYRADEFPGLVRRIRREGHEIGSHGYDHVYRLGQPDAVRASVERADRAIERAAGVRPVYYRPPGGILDAEEERTVRALGHRVVLWTVDSEDWKATDADTIVRNVESHVRPGSIVLFHDGVSGSRYTVAALPMLIDDLRRQGYSFSPLSLALDVSK